MSYKKWIGVLILAVVMIGGYRIMQIAGNLALPHSTEEIAAVVAYAESQDEEAFYRPERRPLEFKQPNPLNNVFFGDLHVHTNMSVDAYLFGNRFDMDTAYQVAKGKSVKLRSGERVELTRPLDFVALTDHAEGFGRVFACREPDKTEAAQDTCDGIENASVFTFLDMRSRVQRPLDQDLSVFDNDRAKERDYAATTWQSIKEAAERYYEPGQFTTFAGYEYSPSLPDRGKNHRNVIFRSLETPEYAVSAYDAASEIDLWKSLEATCTDDCEFLTIPHNPNKTWGLAFSGKTIDGISYTDDDWRLRERSEPIVEMFQIKGNSECSVAFGAGDEECGFEQFIPVCKEGDETACLYPTSMVRDGLQIGMALEDQIGINPLKVGLIGSTDTHNSNPGDTEEWDYRGATTFTSGPAKRRFESTNLTGTQHNNPGGLAAIWARENTREALFDAMKRKEVYATSGTRIRLRVFAGFNLPTNIVETTDITAAYDNGVPMGGSLLAVENSAPTALSVFVWAVKDPDNAPLAKVQVIKGWIERGRRQEVVHDVACGGSQLDPATGKCKTNGATVSLNDCRWDNAAGTSEFKTLWTDPDYDSSEDAFYYVRVIQNPTCRWSTYDSLRLGKSPRSDVPATATEMAWGSPIWHTARQP
jgi:hypothetical protein